MKKIYAFLLLAAIAGFTLASCSKTEPDTPDTPTTQPSEPKEPNSGKIKIPVKMYVELSPATKVEITDNGDKTYNYSFSATDQLVVSTAGASRVHGTLSYVSGQSLYNFSGVLEADSAPEASETITVKLVNTTYGNTGTALASPAISSTLADAVRSYSYFTASFAYGTASNSKIHLTQSSSFIEFNITLDGYADGTYSIKLIDDDHDTENPIVTSDDISVSTGLAQFVMALSSTTLKNAKLIMTGGPNLMNKSIPFGSASTAIAANTRYRVTRSFDDSFTIKAITDNTRINFRYTSGVQYRIDGTGAWLAYDGRNIVLAADHFVSFRGNRKKYGDVLFTSVDDTAPSTNKKVYIYGNLMSLIGDGSSYTALSSFPDTDYKGAFENAFYNATWVDIPSTERLLVAISRVQQNCFSRLFYGVTSLTKGPSFAVTHSGTTDESASAFQYTFTNCTGLTSVSGSINLSSGTNTFREMFNGCTNLVTAPYFVIPVSGSYGCQQMFDNCQKLKTVAGQIVLSSTTTSTNCYWGMFRNCKQLTEAPALPATSVAQSSYEKMFYGCTSLQTSPVVSATTLTGTHSCMQMFYGCTSLISAPVLSAATLTDHCYEEMFRSCSNLKSVVCLAETGIDVNNSTLNWLHSVGGSSSDKGKLYIKSGVTWTTGNTSQCPPNWETVVYTP